MIYSMTLYFNEDDLVNLKIKEEHQYVDKIIIQESRWTHTGNIKPIRFNNKYDNKIVHLVIENNVIYKKCDLNVDRFCRANAERRYPLSQFPINDDDVIIVTDIDEIINGEEIPRIIYETQRKGFVRLAMRAFYYYINVLQSDEWSYPYACSGKIAKKYGLDWLRLNMTGTILKDCGNHFGWLGGEDAIKYKIQNMAHTEFNNPAVINNIKERLENLEDVVGRTDQPDLSVIKIDHLYPKTILNNYAEWKKYVL